MILRALAIAILPGCLLSNEITGHWSVSSPDGCYPGEDVYANVPSGHGPIVAEHVDCTQGGFSLLVDAQLHDFSVELDLHGGGVDYLYLGGATIDLRGITGDFDLGRVTFVREVPDP